jgi:hypothetical protein
VKRHISVSSPHPNPWYRQFPNGDNVWGDWRFTFNDDSAADADYLVAFDDLHKPIQPPRNRCNTIHIATEPPAVACYDPRFTAQFGTCLSLEKEHAHPHVIMGQPGLNWFVGWQVNRGAEPGAMSFAELDKLSSAPKTKRLSIISSDKVSTPAHVKRLAFAKAVKGHFGDDVDFFGRGFSHVDDKIDAILPYRFHIVLENSQYDHYFTEKLSDCLICGTYPIYFGCPNLNEYIPTNSYLAIDIDDLQGSLLKIEHAIDGEFDIKYRNALDQAKQLIMHKHNFFPMIVSLIEKMEREGTHETYKPVQYGQEMIPYYHPRFTSMFGVSENFTWRRTLSSAADKWPLLGDARQAYRKVRSIFREG